MKMTSLIALMVPLISAGPVLAQGTAGQRIACGPDAFRLCAGSIPNVGRITACLRQSREQLSPGCRAEFDKADGATRTAAAPPPSPRVAERPRVERRRIVEAPRRVERKRMAKTPRTRARVAEAPEPRMTPRPSKRERLAAAPEATPRPGTKVSVTRSGNVRTITRTVYVYVPQKRIAAHHLGPRRSFAARGGSSDMAQAMYWMRAVTGYDGSMGELAALMR